MPVVILSPHSVNWDPVGASVVCGDIKTAREAVGRAVSPSQCSVSLQAAPSVSDRMVVFRLASNGFHMVRRLEKDSLLL